MDTKHVDIIIVGAGLIGASLALSLANTKKNKPLKIAVVERAEPLRDNLIPNQRVVALGKTATNILDELGVLAKLGSSFCNPYEHMFVWDECSHGELSFSAQEHHLPVLGHMIDSTQCSLLLQQEIEKTPSISAYYNTTAQALKFDDQSSKSRVAQLHVSNQILSAPLIIAADGAQSWLRQKAKIFTNHRSYQQSGIVARIQTEHSHKDTAWQCFLKTGPIALLPVEKNQSSIVWSADTVKANYLMSLSDREFELQLSQALGNKLGEISLLSKRVAFPLVSQQAESYFKRNVVLVGDAAHTIHPLAGQGANLGFKDIQALVKILSADNVIDFSDVTLLERYQRKRKADNQQTDFMMSALHHIYRGQLPAWLTLRGLGMNGLNRLDLLKSWLVAQASGA